MALPEFELHVCKTCADPNIERRRNGEGGGEALLAAIRTEVAARDFAHVCRLMAFECLGACQRRGRVSISCHDKWGVVFGGLYDRTDAKPLCDYIGAWLRRPWGEIVKKERPAALRNKIIGRIPPGNHHLNCSNPDAGQRPNQMISAVAIGNIRIGEAP
ncbi:DUF1636 family protein [Aestuariivirga sp.]|uniref:DUF1636 family protein n=1 Tax=Aestuariivirga sp. TaxID=2650926 RepID=UPI003BAB9B67